MIPVIQFDPASLSLWYDAHLIAKCRNSDAIRTAIELAYAGRDQDLVLAVAGAPDRATQIRAAHFASTVWHEKRHFLDFLLTNYGAMRVRQFFELYRNLPVLLNQVGESKRLLLPLDSNLDPIKREIFGVGALDPGILQLAESIERRKQMLADDRRPLPVGQLGLTDVGGEAIMEAIAYHVQMGKAHRVFGADLYREIERDQPDHALVSDKYKWAYELLVRNDLLDFAQIGPEGLLIHDAPFIPLLYGALAARFWKQDQTRTSSASSYMPGERLASFLVALRKRADAIKRLQVSEAWDFVNTTAKEIFGRSVIEETEADIALEKQFIETLTVHDQGTESEFAPIAAYREYHELRCQLLSILKREPELILDQSEWSDRLAARLRPKVVVAASCGEIGIPPAGFDRLFGYAHPGVDYSEVPEARWWWAATQKPTPQPDSSLIALPSHKVWCTIISDYAPLAKLVASGLRCRVMLGPELLSIKIRIEQETGVHFIIDGCYAPDVAKHDMAFWYYITGRQRVRCELSFDMLEAPHGCMIDPWELRLRPKLREALVESMEGAAALIQFTMWRDWSPWILGERGLTLLQKYPRDGELVLLS